MLHGGGGKKVRFECRNLRSNIGRKTLPVSAQVYHQFIKIPFSLKRTLPDFGEPVGDARIFACKRVRTFFLQQCSKPFEGAYPQLLNHCGSRSVSRFLLLFPQQKGTVRHSLIVQRRFRLLN